MLFPPFLLEELREAQNALAELAVADLRDVWSRLPLDKPVTARNELVRLTPAITEVWGVAAAALGVEWYGDARSTLGVDGSFTATPADPVLRVAVEEQVRFGAQHLWTANPGQTLAFLEGMVDGYTVAPSRETIQQAADVDPHASGYVRQAQGDACAFCAYMAVIALVDRPLTFSQAVEPYHKKCRCEAVPMFDVVTEVQQDNQDEWVGAFNDAHSAIRQEREPLMAAWRKSGRRYREFFRAHPDLSLTPKNILARARRLQPGLFKDGVHGH